MAIVEQYEGRNGKMVLIEETTFGTKPSSPPGYNLPFTSATLNPGDGFTDFEEIDGQSVPSTPLGARKAPSGTIQFPLHYDAIGWVLKHCVGIPTTSGDPGPYTHVFELGHANGLPAGFEFERQQPDAGSDNKSRLWYAGRCTTFAMALTVEGAVLFDVGLAFADTPDAWSGTLVVASPTAYTSDAIDQMIGVLKVDNTAVAYVTEFTINIDWQVDTDIYPVCNAGQRGNLPRGKPILTGTMTCIQNDDTNALVDSAEANTAVDLDIELTTDANNDLKVDINDARLRQTDESIPGSGGLTVSFDWRAYGTDAVSFDLINSVTSY
jgi:hypothetical protein